MRQIFGSKIYWGYFIDKLQQYQGIWVKILGCAVENVLDLFLVFLKALCVSCRRERKLFQRSNVQQSACLGPCWQPGGAPDASSMMGQHQDGWKWTLDGRNAFLLCRSAAAVLGLVWIPLAYFQEFYKWPELLCAKDWKGLPCLSDSCLFLFFSYNFSLVFGSRAVCHLLCSYSGGHQLVAQLQCLSP